MMKSTCRITIFEGPDGSGKTTAAKLYAKETGAAYYHFPQLPHLRTGLARIYVEAMLPALLGYQDVVMDRCWISEMPYGVVFREGANRVPFAYARMLERLAMRCGAVLVKCDPGVKTCLNNFNSRRRQEMLSSSQQLIDVHHMYQAARTDLPTIFYSYNGYNGGVEYIDAELIETIGFTPHWLSARSAGNWDAKIALVGESFAEPKNDDPMYQWPFASFSSIGCSRWLSDILNAAKIPEHDLFWVNVDQLDSTMDEQLRKMKVIALGGLAQRVLGIRQIDNIYVHHPQHQLRFGRNSPYELINHLNGEQT